MSGLCSTNEMIYKSKEVPDPGCLCFNHTEVKETAPHQLQYTLIPTIQLFEDGVEYLEKWIKGKGTEPNTCTIIYWYIMGTVWKL